MHLTFLHRNFMLYCCIETDTDICYIQIHSYILRIITGWSNLMWLQLKCHQRNWFDENDSTRYAQGMNECRLNLIRNNLKQWTQHHCIIITNKVYNVSLMDWNCNEWFERKVDRDDAMRCRLKSANNNVALTFHWIQTYFISQSVIKYHIFLQLFCCHVAR